MIYISSLIISFLICAILLHFSIPILKKKKLEQVEREEGLKSHKSKNGTPTMGGVFFIFSSIVASILVCIFYKTLDYKLILVIFTFMGYGMIGFVDDFLITKYHNNKGLPPKAKLLLQILVAIVFCVLLKMLIPSHTFAISIFNCTITLHPIIYYALLVLMFTATSNGVNLSDGLDGLSSGLSIFAFIAYLIIAIMNSNTSIAVYITAIIGGLLGFLIYNKHPAKIFMGDAGSLALGGVLASISIILKQELLLIIIGGVFVIEALSVILQVTSYKLTKKRIFKMAPLHHHFEMCGWSETKVVFVFWICGIIFSVLGVLVYIYV